MNYRIVACLTLLAAAVASGCFGFGGFSLGIFSVPVPVSPYFQGAYEDMAFEKGRMYVDLGLPSGTKWATMNVGANSPEDYGDYFAWGETSPKEVYSLSTYKWCKGAENTQTKYCSSITSNAKRQGTNELLK